MESKSVYYHDVINWWVWISYKKKKGERVMEEKKYLNLGQKLAYGAGDFASNFAYTFVSGFVLMYLTNSVGLNSAVIGMLMLCSKIFDGFTDVVFGTLIDRTHNKMGKARPWMFWSTFLLAASVILQFSIPEMSDTLQYAYFFIVYTLMNAVFYTANNIAYSTLSALITKNGNERVQLGAFRYVFALIAAMLISSVTAGMVENFGGGAAGWRNVAILYAVILLIFNTIAVVSVKEIPEDGQEEITEKQGFLNNLGHCIHNKYYLMILGIYIANNMMSGITQGVGIYYMTYVLGNPSMLGLFSMAGMLPMLLGIMATPALVKKFGMYKTNMVSMFMTCVLCVPFMIAGKFHSVYLMAVFMAVRGIFMGPLTGTLNALIAETAKYSYLKENIHVEGTMFSCSSMGIKLGGGIGSAVCGWLLAAGGFDGTAAIQSTGAVNMISAMYIITPLIFCVAMFVLTVFLNVEDTNRKLEKGIKRFI